MTEKQPAISIIGLKNQTVKEVAERIQTVIDESGYSFFEKSVIIRCAPSDKKKSDLSHFELKMNNWS